MATTHFSVEQAQVRSRRSWRAFVLVVASLLLHLIVFRWADGRIGLPAFDAKEAPVITTQLLTPPPAPLAAAAPPAPKSGHAPVKRPKPPRSAANPAPAAVTPPLSPLQEATTAPATTAEPPAELAQALPEESPPIADIKLPLEQEPRYPVAPLPSAELEYDVEALVKGVTYYGSGMIKWHAAGDAYQVTGKAKVAFFTVLDFRSEGALDAFGVSPVIYGEKPRNRAETNTHFHRERNEITFSASSASYPRKGGEQDRASVIWQLAAIGRGDPERFAPDSGISLFVAGTRNAETWQMRILGMEEIDTDAGRFKAWHVTRIPQPGSYERKLDIWLAPEQQWFPVKLRYSEANGDYLDMSLSNLLLTNPSVKD
ncbi:MAG TPA: DUF3108 domain-containing protein [Noviherbaspirillum sp.]|uniref:DUF3108 domain-containing protein n=1 Tax=Noviherbaspirillum sp. TaxID=1926288 RepID=UPI002DDCC2D7|nr:DUF3108 domain-containing protein [Noviherbaspirillum sp.]HEV2611930.1 DUF3108 domain-containing protein [Noviherbaspirillum sp.]